MAIATDDYKNRLEEFQNDLREMTLIGVIRKHITTGSSAVLSESIYYQLRNEVADHFQLHPSAVVLVGSSRLGFSLKPTHRYQPFGESSDVDLAIISPDRFDTYWDMVFEHWRAHRLWTKTNRYRLFVHDLFKGWIWPRQLPTADLKAAIAWVEFEDRLGRELFRGRRSVGARLYRSWERLEAYQAIHVTDCKNLLIRESYEQ
jgi:hypothetical protein